ncbi:hypothetical protein SSX86_008346 [Deinandra increscens subsp. villosa]|uniref:C2 domain-containing protein n=1 Tax=Deinandra increscens subsp. villosa TaxID=3103831 RepID=A0AAP0DF25_9ASTR
MEMGYRNLNVILGSARGLKKARFISKPDVYLVVFISGTSGKDQKLRTSTDQNGNSHPTWNSPMKFFIDVKNHRTLVVKIKAVRMFCDKDLGQVRIPIKELLEGVKTVSYQVKPKGVLSLSYEFGDKFSNEMAEQITAYRHLQQVGYGYPPSAPPLPPPVLGYPTQSSRRWMINYGMGFGTGLLGGAVGGLLVGGGGFAVGMMVAVVSMGTMVLLAVARALDYYGLCF